MEIEGNSLAENSTFKISRLDRFSISIEEELKRNEEPSAADRAWTDEVLSDCVHVLKMS
jgi:hypothetical protein